jgi:hypothetical protein
VLVALKIMTKTFKQIKILVYKLTRFDIFEDRGGGSEGRSEGRDREMEGR